MVRVTRRAQLVLLAAVALAITLVPLALAHVQLGYSDDVPTSPVDDDPGRDAERTLTVALSDAIDSVPESYSWSDRAGAVTTVRNNLAPTLSAVNRSALEAGTLASVTYNQSHATAWASANCPGGPDRQFGPCTADRGVVVQERTGETHVVAVAIDVRIVSRSGELQLTTVLPVTPPRH